MAEAHQHIAALLSEERVFEPPPDFVAGAMIPSRFSCDGQGVSPELRWSGVPAGIAQIVLVVDDPDAPRQPSA